MVTGAGSGIGRAIAMKLAAEYALINVDINGENLAAVEREIATQGFHAQSIVGDVADRATHIKARELAAVNGTLVAWVNCAGWTRGAALHDFPNDPKLFEELIATNQNGTFGDVPKLCIPLSAKRYAVQLSISLRFMADEHGAIMLCMK